MKILAIRGRNLASLAAEFAVDFEAEPLASAGLFAITGPTGAGKSTLLDALCLALYERTPRLARANARSESVPDVGEHALGSADARNLLRRGAGEGWAEVDFVGSDGIGYRSRWSVRRARNKADGKLQPSEIRLSRLADGQLLGDARKTETLRQIEASIGLNFDQFTRAVLLAQHDFATFLKSSDDERAELLQTLTGTETFSRLSTQAYRRMTSEREALDRLQRQIEACAPLATEQRAHKEADLAAVRPELVALGQQSTILTDKLHWYEGLAQLRGQEAQASQRLSEAESDHAQAQPERERLDRLDRVQVARPLLTELDRATRAQEAERVGLETSTSAVARALTARQQQEAAQTQARQALEQAERALGAAQPELEQARVLDERLQALAPQLQAQRQAKIQADIESEQATARQREVESRRQQENTELRQHQDWLAQHDDARALAQGWPRWDALFGQASRLQAQQSTMEQEATLARQRSQAIGADLESACIAHDQASKTCQATAEQLQDCDAACQEINAEALARTKAGLESQLGDLRDLGQLWRRLQELQVRSANLATYSLQQDETLRQALRELDAAERAMPLAKAELRSAEQALEAARLAASASASATALRARLQAGQPCPVCGATEHPHADASVLADAMLASLQAHVHAQREMLDGWLGRLAAANAARTLAERALGDIASDQARLATERATLASSLVVQSRHELAATLEPETVNDWLHARETALQDELRSVNATEAQHRERQRAREQAREALERARAEQMEALRHRQTLEQEAASLRTRDQARQQERERLGQALDALLAELDAAHAEPGWRLSWQADPAGHAERAHQTAAEWSQAQDRVAALRTSLALLEQEASARQAAAVQASNRAQEQTRALQALETDAANWRSRRAALLDGQPVAEVSARLEAAFDQARRAQAQALDALHQASTRHERELEAQRQHGLRLRQQRQAQEQAQADLQRWLAEFNARAATPAAPETALDLSGLRELLAVGSATLVAERDRLLRLDQAVQQARAVLDDRHATLQRHLRAAPSAGACDDSETPGGLMQQLAAIEQQRQAASERQARLRLELKQDDQRLCASAATRSQIETQSARTRIWEQLGELIGSADGKKFRNFAQQLTLDILLGYANAHLQGLTRRYRIKRLRDSLGLLVIDQDMGDEMRSVHSLSGGESFLVSLALALGLASLSSHRVRVESLFIDEGFGSLDAESLNVALDALDRLQSLGRKVGVISHVAELTERIGTRIQVRRLSGGASRVGLAGR